MLVVGVVVQGTLCFFRPLSSLMVEIRDGSLAGVVLSMEIDQSSPWLPTSLVPLVWSRSLALKSM